VLREASTPAVERRAGIDRRSGEDRRAGGDRRTGDDRRAGPGTLAQVASVASSVASSVADLAGTAGAPIASVARPVVNTVDRGVGEVMRRWRSSEAGRAGALRARGKLPLPSLWEEHPEARRASPRELGLQTIPLDAIKGTAVEGPVQRGADFLPIPRLRGPNWLARWQRLRRALERLEILPPIDVIKYGEDHWVVDGHNRVAAALYTGQDAIDAAVVELRPHGVARRAKSTSLAPLLADGADLRAAGSGRYSRTASPRQAMPSSTDPAGVVGPSEPPGKPTDDPAS
jgi:hypothetical protein